MDVWTEAQLASIHKMLNPRSVAVIGATPRLQYGGKFLKRVLSYKDRLNVYAVNPKYDEILGERCYASIAELPEAPDVATIIVPYHAVLDTLRQCETKGVGSAIVISAGFSERGEPARVALQQEVGAFARQSGVRMSGPNCLGLVNVRDDIWLTSSTRVEHANAGPVGIVCQSGASLFGPFLARAMDHGLGMSYAVSTGNEADLEFADFARYLLDDPGTRVIAGFIEGFKDASKFIAVAKLAAERGKPIVLIKIGRSEQGSRAAGSHTAALTGSDALYDAVCKQYGVIRVDNYDELLELAQLLAQCKPPVAKGIAVVSHSGGVSSLSADMLGQAGLQLPDLTPQARDALNGILAGFGSASNPADVTGKANSDEFPAIMQHLVDEPEVGALVVASAGGDEHADQVVELHKRSLKNVVYMWTGSRYQQIGLARLKAASIPIFYNPDALARGLKHLEWYHAWREHTLSRGFAEVSPMTATQRDALTHVRGLGRLSLSESEGKRLIAAWGVPSPKEEIVTSADAAVAAGERLGFPVVVKVESADILHKTEAGAVKVGVGSAGELSKTYGTIMDNARTYAPNANVAGVCVQEMITGGTEVIVGVTNDPQLGPTILFGLGGVTVEIYKDVAMRNCPITPDEARSMIGEVKGSALLFGFRGKPMADVDALVETLVAISQMAVQLHGQLAELDINPLMVLPQGKGVKAADALAVLQAN